MDITLPNDPPFFNQIHPAMPKLDATDLHFQVFRIGFIKADGTLTEGNFMGLSLFTADEFEQIKNKPLGKALAVFSMGEPEPAIKYIREGNEDVINLVDLVREEMQRLDKKGELNEEKE